MQKPLEIEAGHSNPSVGPVTFAFLDRFTAPIFKAAENLAIRQDRQVAVSTGTWFQHATDRPDCTPIAAQVDGQVTAAGVRPLGRLHIGEQKQRSREIVRSWMTHHAGHAARFIEFIDESRSRPVRRPVEAGSRHAPRASITVAGGQQYAAVGQLGNVRLSGISDLRSGPAAT